MILREFDQLTAELIPSMVLMELELELSMYTISDWAKVYFDEGEVCLSLFIICINIQYLENEDQGIKMEVKFKRRLVNELLTTYLPSFLLLGICYATTHFKPFYFEAVVTVNLTVMLVTTTLFIRLVIID